MKTLSRVPREVKDFCNYVNEDKKDIYIFGADIAGKIVKRILFNLGISIKGFIDNNKRSGYGNMTYDNGNIYEGMWKDDKKNGTGIMTYKNRSRYEGMWKDDL
jgi:hypothetical protein